MSISHDLVVLDCITSEQPLNSSCHTAASDGTAELITVTLIVAAEGEFSLPVIRGMADLKLALSKVGGTPASSIMAAELVWAPQAEGDVMTQEQALTLYPNLVPV